MPALNIMAIHETVLNSGSSSSRPSGMAPKRPSASHSTKTTKPDAVRMNSQPVLAMIHVSVVPETLFREGVLTNPQIRKATAMAAVTPNTTKSIPLRPVSAADSTG